MQFELLFIAIIAAAIGAIWRYAIPGRDRYGSVLLPAVSTAVASTVWAGLTWLGWSFDGVWIWVVALAAGGAAALAAAIALPRVRRAADARLLHELSGGRA